MNVCASVQTAGDTTAKDCSVQETERDGVIDIHLPKTSSDVLFLGAVTKHIKMVQVMMAFVVVHNFYSTVEKVSYVIDES